MMKGSRSVSERLKNQQILQIRMPQHWSEVMITKSWTEKLLNGDDVIDINQDNEWQRINDNEDIDINYCNSSVMIMVERQWTWCPSLLYCKPDDFSLASRGRTAVLTLTSAPPFPVKMAAPANTMSTHTGNSTVPVHKSACFLVSVTLCSVTRTGVSASLCTRGSTVLYAVFRDLCVLGASVSPGTRGATARWTSMSVRTYPVVTDPPALISSTTSG